MTTKPPSIDELIAGFDRSLRTLTGNTPTNRPRPGTDTAEAPLSDSEREHAAGLMRINHCGEICAQALYEGQALTAKSEQARETLLNAAQEETDHLNWCRERLEELDAKPSVLDPLFYAASWTMGALTGLAGDRISLGFVEATEDRVVKHLDEHLTQLPEGDDRSRAILNQMREDEAHHAEEAVAQGGQVFPEPVKNLMALVSQVMTKTTYKI
ncbi:MAG: 2-polyprenyl-3-methyl-6-methoxy-1,4-benzoquinone monooxygenase [Pseudomonadota bacterium]